jgi:TRAP-type mannitol/chloroaromatic compound transport system permease small subunit
MRIRGKPSWPWTEVWPWAVGIFAVVIFLLPWSLMSVGRCVDYAPGQGESFCESGPVIGEPAAVVVAVVSALLILYFVYRIVRILVQRVRMRRTESGKTPD